MPKKIIVLPPIKEKWGTGEKYYKQLKIMVKSMTKNMRDFILNEYSYTKNAIALNMGIKIRMDKWTDLFNMNAPLLATEFVRQVDKNTVHSIFNSLKKAPKELVQDLVVKFSQRSQEALNSIDASIIENVALIKSIPQQYHKQIEFFVNEASAQGRNKAWLEANLVKLGDTTKKRAKIIARDQLNKTTSLINVARQKKLGITKNKWHHSKRPITPRVSHEKADGAIYDINKGCLIDGEYIFPAQKINCYCYASPVLEINY